MLVVIIIVIAGIEIILVVATVVSALSASSKGCAYPGAGDPREAIHVADFKDQRGKVAFQFHLFPEEVWAELDLRDRYAEWLERRLDALLRMRQDVRTSAASSLRGTPQPLHAPWMTFELIRLDMVAGLERDDQRLSTLEALKQEWRRDLSRLPMPVGLDDFPDALPKPLERDPSLEARFDRYYDAVLSIAPL